MSHTGDAMRRLKTAWNTLEADDKILVGVQWSGLAAMLFAVAAYYGWAGVLFLVGALLWKCAGHIPSPPSKEEE